MQEEVRMFFFQFVTAVAALSLPLTLPCQAQTKKIIYSFSGGVDGTSPEGGLVLDTNGNLYGVTPDGGANFGGTVFELSPSSGAMDQDSAVLLQSSARGCVLSRFEPGL